jgi:hypothetical protein
MKKYRKQHTCKAYGKNNYNLVPKEQIMLYKNKYSIVMHVVGIGRIESRGAAAELQYPRATVPIESRGAAAELPYLCATVPHRCCSRLERGRGPATRAVRGAGNAGRGASPTAGKREGFSF